MSVSIPAAYATIVGPPVLPALATLNADGSINLTPVWATRDGDDILVATARGHVKDDNLRCRRHASLTFVDPDDRFRYVSITGVVADVADEADPARGAEVTAHVDDAAEAYVGRRPFPYRKPGEIRSMFRIRPVSVLTFP